MRRFEGRVLEVTSELFTAEVTDLDDGSIVHADFPHSVLPDEEAVEPGDIIDIDIRGDIATVSRRDFGTWTEDELQDVRARGKEMADEMRRYMS